MMKSIPSASLILIASLCGGCQAGPAVQEGYRAGPRLLATNDPLVPKREFPAWNPPRQIAIWVQPRQDPSQGILLGGQWILENLTEGGWYVDELVERDPLPDAEATPEELEAARRSLGPKALADFVVPYRFKGAPGELEKRR